MKCRECPCFVRNNGCKMNYFFVVVDADMDERCIYIDDETNELTSQAKKELMERSL